MGEKALSASPVERVLDCRRNNVRFIRQGRLMSTYDSMQKMGTIPILVFYNGTAMAAVV